MSKIGILAYGSLIDDPGFEIEPLIVSRIEDVETPFPIEFARTSKTRDGAPTVIPVKKGGAHVKAQVLVLSEELQIEQAEDLLWRRETRNEGTSNHYSKPLNPSQNRMVVDKIEQWLELDIILYTKLGTNIDNISAAKLADLAISSAKCAAGRNKKDGISYLTSLNKQGIKTALSAEYENAILEKTNSINLEEAWMKLQN